MLKNIGMISSDIEKVISEIYKTNVKFLSRETERVKKQEILLCRQESQAILGAYEKMLLESTKMVINNLYMILESMIADIIPNFQFNQEFIIELIRNEIDLFEDTELDFRDVEITTGSVDFYETFVDIFSLSLDYELGEDLLIFKYRDDIKTIDFSTLQTNLIRDVSSCRIKHLSMIDAIKMRV